MMCATSGGSTFAKAEKPENTMNRDSFARQIMAGGELDTVSGATVTCNAVKEAFSKCKELAGIQ